MSQITETQNVKLFIDEDNIGKKEVHISLNDPCGPWVNILHDGSEMSLSLENWDKLVALAEIAKSKMPNAVQSR